MKKTFLSLVAVSLVFTGCVTKQANIEREILEKDLIKYDNSKHVIGNKNSAIKTLVYTENIEGKDDKKIIFYIDKLPYTAKFNLCEDKKAYRDFESVVTNKKTGAKAPVYFTSKVDCASSIIISKYKDNFEAVINFKMLNGFRVAKIGDFDKLLPYKTHFEVSSLLLKNNIEKQILSRGINEFTYFQFLK
ncbi:hypothetical protein [Sulfurimonas sp.]|uniref:hypothetical protein n=1 Tax=Sulfurimonas sp. TaxID=2022749 RepID=UPI0025CEADDF|nr:hypothetical protein [Sulfurimonas sp.]